MGDTVEVHTENTAWPKEGTAVTLQVTELEAKRQRFGNSRAQPGDASPWAAAWAAAATMRPGEAQAGKGEGMLALIRKGFCPIRRASQPSR